MPLAHSILAAVMVLAAVIALPQARHAHLHLLLLLLPAEPERCPQLSKAAAAGVAGREPTVCLELHLQLTLQYLSQGAAEAAVGLQDAEGAAVAAGLSSAPQVMCKLGTAMPKVITLLLKLVFEASELV